MGQRIYSKMGQKFITKYIRFFITKLKHEMIKMKNVNETRLSVLKILANKISHWQWCK